jgi:microcystin-dependent protein
MLVGLNGADADFDTAEETGGAKTVTLTAAQSGLPAHTHEQTAPTSSSGGAVRFATDTNASGADTAGNNATQANAATNAAQAHENMPPYIVVYMWKRTA